MKRIYTAYWSTPRKGQGDAYSLNRGKGLLMGTVVGVAVVAAVILEAVTSPSVITKTQTVTVTATPSEQVAEIVDGTFAQHLITFESRNVSAIVVQYGPSANVTWQGIDCLDGIYPITKIGSNLSLLLETFFGRDFQSLSIGNVTTPITTMSSNSAIVNSSFALAASGSYGNLSAKISAQDVYMQSSSESSWWISQETWRFVAVNSTGVVLNCFGG
jgi:hypothetical protein